MIPDRAGLISAHITGIVNCGHQLNHIKMIENSGTHYITLFVFFISLVCVAAMLISGIIVTLIKQTNKVRSIKEAHAGEKRKIF